MTEDELSKKIKEARAYRRAGLKKLLRVTRKQRQADADTLKKNRGLRPKQD